jgi:hypothetical protein
MPLFSRRLDCKDNGFRWLKKPDSFKVFIFMLIIPWQTLQNRSHTAIQDFSSGMGFFGP